MKCEPRVPSCWMPPASWLRWAASAGWTRSSPDPDSSSDSSKVAFFRPCCEILIFILIHGTQLGSWQYELYTKIRFFKEYIALQFRIYDSALSTNVHSNIFRFLWSSYLSPKYSRIKKDMPILIHFKLSDKLHTSCKTHCFILPLAPENSEFILIWLIYCDENKCCQLFFNSTFQLFVTNK